MTTEISQSNFETEVIKHPGPVLVDFYTVGCSPCRIMAPILDEIADERRGQLKVVKLDAGQYYELAAQYQISGFPSFILFKNGEVQRQITGSRSKKAFTAWLDEAN
jgi:thioredoxin 1